MMANEQTARTEIKSILWELHEWRLRLGQHGRTDKSAETEFRALLDKRFPAIEGYIRTLEKENEDLKSALNHAIPDPSR